MPSLEPPIDRETIALIFHGIGDPPATVPPEERPYWIERALFLDVLDLVTNRSFQRDVILTFDDGNSSDLFAASELVRRNLVGRFFILAARLGKARFLDSRSAREMAEAGMEVALHGDSHASWRGNSEADWQREIVDARATIEDAIRRPVRSVAIPFGAYDRSVLRRLHSYGFERIYTSDPGTTPPRSVMIRRTPVKRHHTIRDVADIIDDRCGPLHRVRRAIMPLIKSWR